MAKLARTSRVALLSVGSNSALIVMKVAVGLLSGSVSIISEAIHSSMDLIASLIAFFSTKTSSKPADEDHPFGHGKIEGISGIAEGLLIFVAAGLIVNEAIRKILEPGPIELAWAAIAVMLVSAGVNILVSRKLYRVAHEEDSLALEADALHLKTDVLTSLGVAGGVALTWTTGLHILDPIVAILVACLIVKEAWDLCRKGVASLLDTKLPDVEEARVRSVIERHAGKFRDYHKLKTTKSGNRREVDFHITLDPETTVLQAHDLVGELKRDFSHEFKTVRVSVHIDPYREEVDRDEGTFSVDSF
ncbi:MAG: cation diffusion facilitator family transporter [Gordonibacter sp.]|nr:cation diffusion facilitator family transporter [Gordonibacter sp.]